MLVKIALALAVLVACSLILIDFEGPFALSWCISTDESRSVLLELGTLGFDLKFIITVEGCSIFTVQTTFSVNCWSSLCLSFGLDFKPSLTLVHAIESLFIGTKD